MVLSRHQAGIHPAGTIPPPLMRPIIQQRFPPAAEEGPAPALNKPTQTRLPQISPLTSGWERVDKLLQTFHQSHSFPNSHSLLETHSGDILPNTFHRFSPHISHKTKPRQSPGGQETICWFFPHKVRGMGARGTLRAPHPAGSCRGRGVQALHPITPGSPSPARPDVGCLIFLQFCFNTHTILGAGSLSHFLQGIALPSKYFQPRCKLL